MKKGKFMLAQNTSLSTYLEVAALLYCACSVRVCQEGARVVWIVCVQPPGGCWSPWRHPNLQPHHSNKRTVAAVFFVVFFHCLTGNNDSHVKQSLSDCYHSVPMSTCWVAFIFMRRALKPTVNTHIHRLQRTDTYLTHTQSYACKHSCTGVLTVQSFVHILTDVEQFTALTSYSVTCARSITRFPLA